MSIQNRYCIVFAILVLLQIVCAIKAHKSDRPIGKYTARLNLAITVPMIANILIIQSANHAVSCLGYYLSYIGMNAIMISMVYFTNCYCKGVDENKTHSKPYIIYFLLLGDMIQLIAGSLFHNVFKLETVMLEGKEFYRDVPRAGLYIHRVVDYVIFACVLLIYTVATIKSSRLYKEKYVIILVSLALTGAFQLVFIKSGIPIDRSLIAHGAFGVVIFYFSIVYKPLRALDTLLSQVVSDMNDAVFVFNNEHKIEWVNDMGYTVLGLEKDGPRKVSTGEIKKVLFGKFKNMENKGENWSENRIIGCNYYILEKKSVKSDQKFLDGSVLVIKDDTERHNAIEREIYNSTHDLLTGLFNSQYLYSRVFNELISSDKEYYAILINIKNFKLVNENYGKAFGDAVLISVADWIRANVKTGVYGRLVGDLFGICMPQEEFDEQHFLKELSDFVVEVKNTEFKINIHIGVYGITDRKLDVSVMFDRAHLAITGIEENFKTVIRYYNEELKKLLLEEQRLVADISTAIKTDQIIPYLQPIADKNGKIVGAEALARWIHPELGFLPPDRFIALFEKNGEIGELDMHIWRHACKILAEWKNTHPDMFISINISPKDFYFIDVLPVIRNMVKQYGTDPAKLRLEITETVMMTDSEERIRILNEIRKEGFIVEMDDFGSGYSSLNLLKDMPVDVLKLDMRFLSEENNSRSDIIIKNIINLANELYIVPLTEGVETQEQFNMLKSMGCELFQGYYFAKPMPLADFEKLANSSEVNKEA